MARTLKAVKSAKSAKSMKSVKAMKAVKAVLTDHNDAENLTDFESRFYNLGLMDMNMILAYREYKNKKNKGKIAITTSSKCVVIYEKDKKD
jgi:hypothetical protein